MKCSFDNSSFLEEIFQKSRDFLKRSLVLPFLLFSSISLFIEEGLFAILWNYGFSLVYCSLSPLLFAFLSLAICKASSDSHFAFLHFFFLGMVLFAAPEQYYGPLPIVLQVLCLWDLIHWIYLSPPLCIHSGFDQLYNFQHPCSFLVENESMMSLFRND